MDPWKIVMASNFLRPFLWSHLNITEIFESKERILYIVSIKFFSKRAPPPSKCTIHCLKASDLNWALCEVSGIHGCKIPILPMVSEVSAVEKVKSPEGKGRPGNPATLVGSPAWREDRALWAPVRRHPAKPANLSSGWHLYLFYHCRSPMCLKSWFPAIVTDYHIEKMHYSSSSEGWKSHIAPLSSTGVLRKT